MSLNTSHLNDGCLVYNGETILIFSDGVVLEFSGQDGPAFKGSKRGRIFLTSHRMIFINKDKKDPLLSFSFPFVTLSNMDLEQPIFGANYIKGQVRAQPNGNFVGDVKFKLSFKSGGCIDFGQALVAAANLASRQGNGGVNDAPPPYSPPQQWYAAPDAYYTVPQANYYGWNPPAYNFPPPPSNTIFVADAPPPYPGINTGAMGAGVGGMGFQGGPGMGFGGQPPMGYPPGANPMGMGGMGGMGMGFQPGGPGGVPPGVPSAPGAPPAQNGYPGSYPGATGGGAMGFQGAAGGFNSADAKAAEAAQSAYYDPNKPQMAYVPPPAYYEHPPTYDEATHKKQQ